MSKEVRDFDTNEVIGTYLKYKGDTGPCIYGKTEFKPDESFKQRCLAAIASRESPIRSSKKPSVAKYPLVPGYSSVQAYEPWVSLGMCHAISRNGNAQKLMQRIVDEVPDLCHKLEEYGYRVSNNVFRLLSPDTEMTLNDLRREHFCVSLHKILEDERTIPIQCDFFWGLIEERFSVVKDEEWFEPAMEDERIMLIIASLSINAGVGLFRRCLANADDYTADALTASRIQEYTKIGSEFGVDRANWERTCKYVVDKQKVII
jgi:hypothetical protein